MLNHEKSAAEDLLQEVFMKLYRARVSYEPRAKFSTWAFTVARNHCLNFIKSRRFDQARRTISLNTSAVEDGTALLDSLAADSGDETGLRAQDYHEALERAIGTLSNGYKEVFLLRALEGLSHNEIAAVIGTTAAAARIRYHRARSMLRGRLSRTTKERNTR
jgi:RNA polymerase sigma-70 factor (ECF subfamily)